MIGRGIIPGTETLWAGPGESTRWVVLVEQGQEIRGEGAGVCLLEPWEGEWTGNEKPGGRGGWRRRLHGVQWTAVVSGWTVSIALGEISQVGTSWMQRERERESKKEESTRRGQVFWRGYGRLESDRMVVE